MAKTRAGTSAEFIGVGQRGESHAVSPINFTFCLPRSVDHRSSLRAHFSAT